MGKRTSYPPGTFSWVDLSTGDAAAEKSFYAGLFGWQFEDATAGGDMVYTVCRLYGDAVCGLFERPEGAPPAWTSYVTVEDADAVAARVSELGGRVVMEPHDVLDEGRTAVFDDP